MLVERIEPRLGDGRPTLLDLYPLPEAAWAQRADDPRLARRFELYACGVELANGFAEITDAAEQRARFETAMASGSASTANSIRSTTISSRPSATCRRPAGLRSASIGW